MVRRAMKGRHPDSTLASDGFEARSIAAAASLLVALGCFAEHDLSSYSEGAAPEEGAPLMASADAPANPGASRAGAAPAATDTAVDETGSADAPLDPTAPNALQPAAIGGADDRAPSGAPPTDVPGAAPPPGVDAGDSCVATGGFTIAEGGSCYLLGDNVSSWQEARDVCQAWGGDLVEIGSLEENGALAQRIDGSAWIGANDQEAEGTFRWANGSALAFTAWLENQPNDLLGNEDCTELLRFDGQWVDVPCAGEAARQALCERP
jgi:hypothetical protein